MWNWREAIEESFDCIVNVSTVMNRDFQRNFFEWAFVDWSTNLKLWKLSSIWNIQRSSVVKVKIEYSQKAQFKIISRVLGRCWSIMSTTLEPSVDNSLITHNYRSVVFLMNWAINLINKRNVRERRNEKIFWRNQWFNFRPRAKTFEFLAHLSNVNSCQFVCPNSFRLNWKTNDSSLW